MSGSVRVTSRLTGEWLNATSDDLDRAVLEMATDIHRGASLLAPQDTGSLVKSGKVNRKGEANYSVSFGGGQVPYALRRHYENKKTPSSLLYLEKAGDAVSRGSTRKYIKGSS